MKLWCSVRQCAASISAAASAGQSRRAWRPGCWSWCGWAVTFQTKRSQRCGRQTSCIRCCAAASSTALSATGACTAAKGRPIFSAGAQCEGTQTASAHSAVESPSTIAKSSCSARLSRPATRCAGGSDASAVWAAACPPGDPVRRCPSQLRRQPRAGAAMPSPSPASAAGHCSCASCARARQAGSGSKPGTHGSASPGARCSTASFSANGPEPGSRACSVRAPAATRRSPGCMRKGAVTAASKSKAMGVMVPRTGRP